MRPFGNLDLVIAVFAGVVGTISLYIGSDIWRLRSGGVLARALAAKLFAFGLWTYFVAAEGFYQWKQALLVSSTVQVAADIDRLIICVPQFIILIYVIPRALRK
jgi:hypothetical protein